MSSRGLHDITRICPRGFICARRRVIGQGSPFPYTAPTRSVRYVVDEATDRIDPIVRELHGNVYDRGLIYLLDRPRGLTFVERVWSNPSLIERWSAGSTQCLC
jgi:hypothetical protein